MAATCLFMLPLAPPIFRDMERCSRLEKISTWSELQYLAISNRCTRNWEKVKKKKLCKLGWASLILVLVGAANKRNSGTQGGPEEGPRVSHCLRSGLLGLARLTVQSTTEHEGKHAHQSRCSEALLQGDKVLADLLLTLPEGLLPSFQQRRGQISALLSCARPLPSPA